MGFEGLCGPDESNSSRGEREPLYVYISTYIYIYIYIYQNINDEEIKMLSKALPFVIESGLANSTNKKYFHGWKTWVDWCNSKQEVDLCPADPFYVTIFLNHILFTSGKKGSVITTFIE